ncbi:helix-turn-helix domain-containing protein [Paenibacillus sp. M2]|uniref:helix-turn-helix domain-containing protein n=1 Tax=Paenibacillus sp. M2 TaxID=3341793 RepID=UPI003989524E
MSGLRQLIGTRIRAMRNTKGLTQQKLADIAGLDYRYIGALERGERNFSIDTLEKVLLALDISMSELMYLDKTIEGEENTIVRIRAIDEFIVATGNLNKKQIETILEINERIFKLL